MPWRRELPVDGHSERRDEAMPLKRGRSKKTVGANIGTLVHEYDRDGTIGSSHPASRKKAIRQAVAISLAKAGRTRRRRPAGK
jgi:hypothetical protein